VDQIHWGIEYSHPGVNKTQRIIKSNYGRNVSAAGILKRIEHCLICAKAKSKIGFADGENGTIPGTKRKGHSISLDIAGPYKLFSNLVFLLITVCRLTRKVRISMFYKMPTASELITEVEIDCFLDNYRPTEILTDRAPMFVSSRWRTHWESRGCTVMLVATHHSEGGDLAERMIQIVKEKIQCVIISSRKNWTEYLLAIQEAINNTLPESTLVTPNQSWNSNDHLKIARRNLKKYQSEMIEKSYLNRQAKGFTFNDGVWVDTHYYQKTTQSYRRDSGACTSSKKLYRQRNMN
jgi:hypothetical protein